MSDVDMIKNADDGNGNYVDREDDDDADDDN